MKKTDIQRLKVNLLENSLRLKELEGIAHGEPHEILANLQAAIAGYRARVETMQSVLDVVEPPPQDSKTA